MSERNLNSNFKEKIGDSVIYPILFIQAEFQSGFVRICSSATPVSWDSKTWQAGHGFVSIGPVSETTEVRAEGVTVTVSGIDSSWFDPVMMDDYQGNRASIWIGLIDSSTGSVVSDPILYHSGEMDSDEITEDGTSTTVSIAIESRLSNLLEERVYRYTHEDQKSLYPNATDYGLEFVGLLQQQKIVWGRG